MRVLAVPHVSHRVDHQVVHSGEGMRAEISGAVRQGTADQWEVAEAAASRAQDRGRASFALGVVQADRLDFLARRIRHLSRLPLRRVRRLRHQCARPFQNLPPCGEPTRKTRKSRRDRDGRSVTLECGEPWADDPFACLGFRRGFVVDADAVSVAHARALARAHPDRHGEGIDREIASQRSATLNRAAAVLRDPLARAEALIALEDPSGVAVPLSASQLLDLFERRDAVQSGDGASQASRAQTQAWLRAEIQSSFRQLEASGPLATVDWVHARALTAYIRALGRLSSEIERLARSESSGGAG